MNVSAAKVAEVRFHAPEHYSMRERSANRDRRDVRGVDQRGQCQNHVSGRYPRALFGANIGPHAAPQRLFVHGTSRERGNDDGAALASCCKILNTDRRRERTLPLHRRRVAIRYSLVASDDRPRRGVEGVSMR